MRTILVGLFVLAIASAAGGYDLGARPGEKAQREWPVNVPQADRQGGDTIADAVLIPALPYETTGTTTGFNNDYDEACPYAGSTAPDVVYTFTAPYSMAVDIDMLGSTYDTKIYLYDANLNLVACNDDYYADYVSALFNVPLTAAHPYYLVIDGYGQEHGEFNLTMTEFYPCDLSAWCDRTEDEPPLMEDYEDAYNGGCNSPQFGAPFQGMTSGTWAPFTFCGRSGWYLVDGAYTRDTDWFVGTIGPDGYVYIVVDAEYAVYLFELAPHDCGEVEVVQNVIGGPCTESSMAITGTPGSEIWFWVGPTTFATPNGTAVWEFDYVLEITGLGRPHFDLGPDDDYTFGAQRFEYGTVDLDFDADSTSVNDADLAELCGGEPTPGPDLVATFYMAAGDYFGGRIFPFWYAGRDGSEIRTNRICLSVVSDLRSPDATCVGYRCASSFNEYLGPFAADQSGWYYLLADFVEPGGHSAWASFGFTGTPPPLAPAHDTCAGAILLERGPIAITDDLTACTNAVDPGRDGCDGRPELAYTSRDAIYRIDFTHGDILELTMLGEGDWDEALYLVRDCDNPLGTCVTAATPWGDGVHISYTALENETLWLICDSWDVGDRPFTLTGSLDNITNAPPVAPAQLALRAAPNPFNPATQITYDVPRATHTRLRIHDLRGRLVATLVDAPREPGRHAATWRAESTRGGDLPSGSYIVRLEAAGEVRTTRLTLLK